MDYRDNRQRWAESHQVVHFYAGQWCTFTPALTRYPPKAASCRLPGTPSNSCSRGSRQSLPGGTVRRCCPRERSRLGECRVPHNGAEDGSRGLSTERRTDRGDPVGYRIRGPGRHYRGSSGLGQNHDAAAHRRSLPRTRERHHRHRRGLAHGGGEVLITLGERRVDGRHGPCDLPQHVADGVWLDRVLHRFKLACQGVQERCAVLYLLDRVIDPRPGYRIECLLCLLDLLRRVEESVCFRCGELRNLC